MNTLSNPVNQVRPYLLSSPALLLYIGLFMIPLIMTLMLSFYSYDVDRGGVVAEFSFTNYVEVLSDSYFHGIFFRTFALSIAVTVLCVLLGTPEAYILHRMSGRWKSICMLAILGPLLVSVVVRTLGWAILFGSKGVINESLLAIGVIDTPIKLMFTNTGVIIALVHVLVPFMVLSVWASLQKLDPMIENAGLSLGASPFIVLRQIVVPQIMPGILSGSLIVFALTASAFATPSILGGRRLKVVATTAYDEYLGTLNWPLGAAIAVLLLVANVIIITTYNKFIERKYSQAFK
ncbi:ABC transporter permease [Marinomonas transparens]|uniref:ABC transporter permease n=1 Tax=Marinomonas transparens TaxID=2795388 RepID=A0A934N1D5_9GAMM|nr:ABC transporter permease [Marinomonas transparens]MBJ7537652.1 ABC transporter permease [Marinomonas transparens]